MNETMQAYRQYELLEGIEGMEAHDEFVESCAGECAAENAWLIAAESSTPEDEAFEAWEMGRGCYLDPQSGY